MSKQQRHYSPLAPTSLDMTELVKTTLDDESTLMLIDKWLEHRGQPHDAYYEWFRDVRERRQSHNQKQILVWNKGEFDPENIFCRTVDTGRLIPLHRMWTTHVYCHRSMQERKLPMLQVVFTMLPELMLLRGMHETRCDEIFIIVTDLKRQEMDDVTEYFKFVFQNSFGRVCKPSVERQIQYEHMRISHTLHRRHRLPCFPQLDLTLRAILHEKKPPFLILFSPQPTSYSQILFTHPSYVPDEGIFFDYPTGCPNPCCTEDCEMIRFPRRGVEGASVLEVYKGRRNNAAKGAKGRSGGGAKRIKERDMCNWVECDACFSEGPAQPSYAAVRTAEREERDEEHDTGREPSAKSDRDRERNRREDRRRSGNEEDCRDTSADGTNSEGSRCSVESNSNSTNSDAKSCANGNSISHAVNRGGNDAHTTGSNGDTPKPPRPTGQLCSKCKLVKYCSAEHQRMDWEEHKRVCVKMNWG
ncbi:hypothetical protein K435DRAFT_965649 [Dendrothele bispora CBS 962.96]|uniref:MYND-type domain-containing protein n=1 Tax=Dendrothele bispora (strain CBS 962.96) TaxID=1314807 RepID=A0A4S8M565_DENBC|nr:hypothetical protein K435DRAFT_965649 [Dendrothele bispora CBS 962.96]